MDEKFQDIRKYNLWDSDNFDFGYERNVYTNKIMNYTGNHLIKVLVGQRRAGKSYVLRQVARKLVKNGVKAKNTLIINRELSEFDFLTTHKDLEDFIKLYKAKLKPKGKVYIFIDEVQMIEGWEKTINSCSQDYAEAYEMFITGSNSSMLSGELATLLSGRYVCFEILPFSFCEYAGVLGKGADKKCFVEYMNSGGLPELVALSNPELQRNYVSSVKDTVLLRDIIQRRNIRDPRLLEDIFVLLVNNASNLISVSSIVNYFKSLGRKMSYDVVSNYIKYIEDTFILHHCDRYDIKGKDTISGNVKYYLNDLSYRNYIYPGFGYGLGYLLENIVYLELRRAGYAVYTGVAKGKEVDFVAIKADNIIYLQCAYLLADETTIEREYSALESIQDSFEKIVVSLDDITLPLRGGIRHVQAWKLAEVL